MGNRLYVGNLALETTEDDLRESFGQFGEVDSANLVLDRDTGRSRGFGFVEMENEDAAQEAIAALDGVELAGSPLRVSEARERQA